MPTTSRALFAEIIDYAGIFPPAVLPLEEAFNRFVAHRRSDSGWLVSRFVCPASRLAELASLMENTDLGQTPVLISALGAGGDDPPGFAGSIEQDTEDMKAFSRRLGNQGRIDIFEVKLPAQGDVAEVVDVCFHNLGEVGDRPPRPYFEIPMVGERPDPHLVAKAIASAAHEIDPIRRAGLKIRCGGLDAAAVPTVEAVASALKATLEAGLPIKATQGLHHPLRGEDSSIGAITHGFVNLLAATALAYEHFLDEETICRIIAEEDPETFRIDAFELCWRDTAVDYSSVVECRLAAFTSFGSCSFSEPRDDLADLGWI
jgi:hypothetical protein